MRDQTSRAGVCRSLHSLPAAVARYVHVPTNTNNLLNLINPNLGSQAVDGGDQTYLGVGNNNGRLELREARMRLATWAALERFNLSLWLAITVELDLWLPMRLSRGLSMVGLSMRTVLAMWSKRTLRPTITGRNISGTSERQEER